MTHATVSAQRDGVDVVIILSGEIDLDNASEVESQIHEAISNRTGAVVLDLADVAYIDSIGMRVLFSLATTLQSIGIGMTITAPPGTAARRVIQLSGLDAVAALEP